MLMVVTWRSVVYGDTGHHWPPLLGTTLGGEIMPDHHHSTPALPLLVKHCGGRCDLETMCAPRHVSMFGDAVQYLERVLLQASSTITH